VPAKVPPHGGGFLRKMLLNSWTLNGSSHPAHGVVGALGASAVAGFGPSHECRQGPYGMTMLMRAGRLTSNYQNWCSEHSCVLRTVLQIR